MFLRPRLLLGGGIHIHQERTYMALVEPKGDTAALFDRHRGVVDSGDGVQIEILTWRFGCGR